MHGKVVSGIFNIDLEELTQVGDIIHLREDQEVPCDCIVLTSSHVQVNTHLILLHIFLILGILLHIWISLIL